MVYFCELTLNQAHFQSWFGDVNFGIRFSRRRSRRNQRNLRGGPRRQNLEDDQTSRSHTGAGNRQTGRQQQLQRRRKRIKGTKQAFLNKKEYETIVDAADIDKLAKMLRILGFLAQTKVYLFWKKDKT